jgi:hypothetical protein
MRLALAFLLLLTAPLRADDYPGAPASVVAAFIEADGEGLALSSDTFKQLVRYAVWPDAPGWDTFTVIKSYAIGEVGWTGKKASVQITYDVVGTFSALTFTPKPEKEAISFELRKRKDKWKIISPQLQPHLFVVSAITALEAAGAKDDAEGKASLEKLRRLQ